MATWKELEDKLDQDISRFGLRKAALNALGREDKLHEVLEEIASCESYVPADALVHMAKIGLADDPQ
jgi:hypothetical protein